MRIDEGNRYNANAEAAKQDQNKANVKSKNQASTAQATQQAGQKAQTKEAKSAFDQVLDQLSSNKPSANTETAKFDSRLKDVLSDRDRDRDQSSDRKKDKDGDKKTDSSEGKSVSRSHQDIGSKHKVLGKNNLGGQSQGGSQNSEGGSGGSSKQFGQGLVKQKGIAATDAIGVPGMATLQKTSTSFAIKSAAAPEAGKIPKQILDQIVQYIRIGRDKNLNKEIQIDLSDKIYQGLSLKVTSNNGKIEVAFLTGNPNIKRQFESQKMEIGEELQDRGVAISQIRVQFLG